MFPKIILKLKQISSFPLQIHSHQSYLYKKIYAKHWLYYFCLTEIRLVPTNIQIQFYTHRCNKRVLKQKIQTLRSPNRHKVAQFHTAKRFFETISTIHIIVNNKTLDLNN